MDETTLLTTSAVARQREDYRGTTGVINRFVNTTDPLYAQPHEPDIQALLRICEVYNVAIATNLATAAAIMASLT